MNEMECLSLKDENPIRPERRRSSRPTRRKSLLTFTLVALLAIILGVGILAWRDTTRPVLRVIHVPVQGLSRTYRILQVSDLHGSEFRERQEGLARLVQGKRYDAVAFTGDMVRLLFEDKTPAIDAVGALKDNGPVFYVSGNHDDTGVAPALVAAGATDLEAVGSVRLGTDDQALVLTTGAALATARESDDDVLVVLTHIPPSEADLLAAAAPPRRTALVLAGHTHGGTIRLPFVGAIVAPPMGTLKGWNQFPEMRGFHVQGLRKHGDIWMHISPGLAAGSHPAAPQWWKFRLGARAEIEEIVLEPARQ
ncbi:MAG: hypothetical protein E4H28_04340 [Gemmatimonadales bacterium]|nr:MAG: hypothetical protein E4H28_04340 [Gemmatimonadales bacterium]